MKPILPSFALRDRVWIGALKTSGIVLAIYLSCEGIQYSVRYIFNGTPQTVYFFGFELEAFRRTGAAA